MLVFNVILMRITNLCVIEFERADSAQAAVGDAVQNANRKLSVCHALTPPHMTSWTHTRRSVTTETSPDTAEQGEECDVSDSCQSNRNFILIFITGYSCHVTSGATAGAADEETGRKTGKSVQSAGEKLPEHRDPARTQTVRIRHTHTHTCMSLRITVTDVLCVFTATAFIIPASASFTSSSGTEKQSFLLCPRPADL